MSNTTTQKAERLTTKQRCVGVTGVPAPQETLRQLTDRVELVGHPSDYLVDNARAGVGAAVDECFRRLEAIATHGRTGGAAVSFVVITVCGHWGRGATLAEAAQQAYKAGARKRTACQGYVVIGDSRPSLTTGGRLEHNAGAVVVPCGNMPALPC